jgi:hypothetical protein
MPGSLASHRLRHALLLLGAVIATSCLRGGFEPWPVFGGDIGADSDGGDGGAVGDGGNGASVCVWSAFSVAAELAELNSPDYEFNPALSADGLEIFWDSNRPGGSGDFDLYRARRASMVDFFGPVERLDVLNSPAYDGSPCLSHDGTTIYFDSARSGSSQIWMATRADAESPFSVPVPAGGIFDYLGTATSVDLSENGLHAYFSLTTTAASVLAVGRRDDPAQPFGFFSLIEELDQAGFEAWPAVARGQRDLVFATWLEPTDNSDLAMTSRARADLPFDPPRRLDEVNTTDNDDDPDLSEEGRVLVFSSWRGGGTGNADLWMADRGCLP